VDHELGRLLGAFAARGGAGGYRIVVVGDHGESLGEHGEAQHGNLLYQGAMRVPLLLAGGGVPAAVVAHPVSARRVHDTLLAWAGGDAARSLLAAPAEPVLGEAMQPFLAYGWQPQTMLVEGRLKVIRAGETEVYDVVADPAESRDLAAELPLGEVLGGAARAALRDYPLPAAMGAEAALPEETRERLASLGYVAAVARPRLRPDAPAPRRMTHLFADLDLASGRFVRGDYSGALEPLERVVAADPGNPMAAAYLAVAHSMLGRDGEAMRWFGRAAALAPGSVDLRHYQAQHHCKNAEWALAEPLLESVLAHDPGRLGTLACLSEVREAQGRLGEAAALLERVVAAKSSPAGELLRLGGLRMAAGDTPGAISAFERARQIQGAAFAAHLELGVCYLAARRLAEARDSLDRVAPSHPGYPMALFKRAQVSVLLAEPDRRDRVRRALAGADETTRPLIERETLFRALGGSP
jgi:Tfp pilus assembly protein PilF